MGKYDKLILQILRGLSDANISFDDLQHLLEHLGFEVRIRGSHHVYRRTGILEKINLQRQGAKAKPYQVKQVREIIQKYRLDGEE
jgi:predicted RNA binding protein YcfA (HicA-like mRNA interferase family)